MDAFWKATASVLIAVVLSSSIAKAEKDISLLLTVAVCSIIAITAVTYLKPVLDFLYELCSAAQFQNGVLNILLKCVGISLVSELACAICSDTGNSSMAKIMQLLSTATIACISVPILQSVLTMVQEILF